MSYSIATNELTLADIRGYKAQAINAGVLVAQRRGIGDSLYDARDNPKGNLTVRAGFPFTDFGNGAMGWLTENYVNPAIAAVGWGSVFSAGALPAFAPQLANTKVAVFYKFANTSAIPLTTAVRFRIGNQGSSTKGTFYLQLETEAKLEPDVYFSEPVVYEPQDFIYIEAWYTAIVGAGGQTFPFGTFIIERLGPTVS
ncbi:MAG: hypothetical protein PHN44_00670 [Candidatus Marinimicrobia bacterium]|nr:hypothetical protein [Candidatus Neomarinimicrobiota bacterium]MDD5539121.1 hypothetical protein [Candidatus Neomarinimicrobiota bacterium]